MDSRVSTIPVEASRGSSPRLRRSDAGSPPSEARRSLHPLGGRGGGADDDLVVRVGTLEDGHARIELLLEHIATQQRTIIDTLGSEPQPLAGRPGSGLLGAVSEIHAERAMQRGHGERFWKGVASVSGLVGALSAISALWPRIVAFLFPPR